MLGDLIRMEGLTQQSLKVHLHLQTLFGGSNGTTRAKAIAESENGSIIEVMLMMFQYYK